MRDFSKFLLLISSILIFAFTAFAQNKTSDEKAEAIVKKAVERLGGQKYLQAKTQISTGNFTLFVGGEPQQLSTFTDVMSFPDKERTEFKQSGAKNVQANSGDAGWLYDGTTKIIKEQSKLEVEDFRRGILTSLDNLLRGNWRGQAILTYAGKRQASVGKRNDVVRLIYADGLAVEFEFSDDGFPAKSIYKRKSVNGEDITEEERYAQFVETGGIHAPFIIDHFINDAQRTRINYLTIEFNKPVSDAIFTKPKDAKELKKDLRF